MAHKTNNETVMKIFIYGVVLFRNALLHARITFLLSPTHQSSDYSLPTHLVTAIAVRGVLGAGFHTSAFPVMSASALFQPYTAHGKLNAEMTPTTPSGFHASSSMCPGRSDGMICPLYDLHRERENKRIRN